MLPSGRVSVAIPKVFHPRWITFSGSAAGVSLIGADQRLVLAAVWPNITFLASSLMVLPKSGLTSGARA